MKQREVASKQRRDSSAWLGKKNKSAEVVFCRLIGWSWY
jgi:hypothetical protein